MPGAPYVDADAEGGHVPWCWGGWGSNRTWAWSVWEL